MGGYDFLTNNAAQKYVKNSYDRIELTVPKGKKEVIKAHAGEHGGSLNG